jgi:hypothetical protein
MYKFSLILFLLASAVAWADQDADIYNGILTEAKMHDTSVLDMGRQGRATLFSTTVTALSTLGTNNKSKPMTFVLDPADADNMVAMTGSSKTTYRMGPVCTEVTITVKAHMPADDTTYTNIYVESVNLEVSSITQCL